ncbi:MAG: SDR family oxidoreductase [Sphingomonas sp.]|uniref:SDR family oxidoreductase n=1 Tax=Sphingomonas sp. TaxID=28214 RepID=UPI003F80CF9C
MDLELTTRRALVLGASRGLGAAIAGTLASEGATVVAASRSGGIGWANYLEPAIAQRITALALDLADTTSLAPAIERLMADGPIDILINNSGGPPPGPITGVTASVWQRQFATMATSLFDITAQIAPGMVERGWGRILTIASSGVEQPIPNLGISNTIRASILGWSKTLANELAPSGVTVNVLLPGRIHTDRVDELDAAAAKRTGTSPQEIARASAASIPIGRYGDPAEFAAVATFLCSERASYVTGSKIRVDGGAIRSL